MDSNSYIVQEMADALAKRLVPAITRWNRLEGRPRTHNFERALQAEVRDALWMLSRQWQLGEFQADDAGSPVLARVCVDVAGIDRFQAGSGAVEGSLGKPLEPLVEQVPLPLRVGGQYLSLDLRLAVGMRWLKLLGTAGLSKNYEEKYVQAYGVQVPNATHPGEAEVCAHAGVWQQVSAVAGRMMDGISFLEYLGAPGSQAFDRVGAVPVDQPRLTELADKLKSWFASLILQPAANEDHAWQPSRLEYQFACSATAIDNTEIAMRADEYYQGHLDWYALERSTQELQPWGEFEPPKNQYRTVKEFIPTSVVFDGMPNTRWWAFEDYRTNFGELRPDMTDLGKLLLMEFGLVYANDWFIVPCTLPVGTVSEVKGIALSNVFGERFWIEPVAQQPEANWDKWTMFTLSTDAGETDQPPAQLILLPTLPAKLESAPVEQVALIRDEMANMVWGVELKIPLASGASGNGRELSRELLHFLQQQITDRRAKLEAIPAAQRSPAQQEELDKLMIGLVQGLGPDPKAPLRYEVMNTVPEHWIPFIPVKISGSNQIQLQRAALPRILEGAAGPPEKTRPRTTLLRANLPAPYYIHEEEVPRAGVVVSQSYQRARWVGGQVFTWLGARKQTGRGEGASGLRFDSLINTPREVT